MSGDHAALRAIAQSLSDKGVRKGLMPMSAETIEDAVSTLARDDSAFDFIDDQEARLGLDVADERQQLTLLFEARGFPATLK